MAGGARTGAKAAAAVFPAAAAAKARAVAAAAGARAVAAEARVAEKEEEGFGAAAKEGSENAVRCVRVRLVRVRARFLHTTLKRSNMFHF